MKRAPLEAESAASASRGLDPEPAPGGSHGPLHVSEVVLEQLDRHVQGPSQLLELVRSFDEQGDDLLSSGQGSIHEGNCTDHHAFPASLPASPCATSKTETISFGFEYIGPGMTETDSAATGSGLSPEVRHALLELVEKGLASARHLRDLAAGGPRLVQNRSALLSEIDARLARKQGFTVTAGSLANLSIINQIYGFAIGDLLQDLVAATTELVLLDNDPDARIAKIAGAQFVVLHGDPGGDRDTKTVQRIQQACNTVALNRHRRSVVPRVAMVSLEIPDGNGMDSEEILKVLSYSQLQTRQSHLEPVIIRGDVDHEGWLARLRKREIKATRITDALRRGDVEVHFQPIIELATRNLYNVEVLARIRTDEGLMVATEFIDSVYQLGEIVELDSQVFARLREVAPQITGVTGHLFINVSPVSLLSSEFRELMTKTVEDLRTEGVGMFVVLELTEQAIVEHLDIIHELHQLHNVKFAVDDFGTGYSSLKTLSDLAVAKVISHLKLDGSLIREIVNSREAFKVVLAIANLAKSLDLKVVAEHVESEAVLEKLRSIGVELGQGRLFDMPLPLLGLVEGYSEMEPAQEGPSFSRPELKVLHPYLDKAFTTFYDRLLSNDHFQAFFRDEDQVRDLVDRQRASFVQSMGETDAELRTRYVELGRLHHHLGVPFPSFMKGADMLHEELLSVLAHVADQGGMVYQSAVFFNRLKNHLARGYLDEMVVQEEEALSLSLDSVCTALESIGGLSLAWVQKLVDAVRHDRFDSPPRPDTPMADASDQLDQRVSPHLTKDSARQILDAYTALHADGESLAFFLGLQEYSSVMMLYRQLHDRVITMQQALEAAGLGH